MTIKEHSSKTNGVPSELRRFITGDWCETRYNGQPGQRFFKQIHGHWVELGTHESGSTVLEKKENVQASFQSSFQTSIGGMKKFAQMFIDGQKSLMAQYLAENGINKYTDKDGNELTPDQVYRAKQLNPLKELQPTNTAQQQGADFVEEHAATAAIIAAVSAVATKGRSTYKEFKNLDVKETIRTFKKLDLSDPLSIVGKSHKDIEVELVPLGFTKQAYRGRSEGYAFKKFDRQGNSEVVVNYGGGRHTGKISDKPIYYKLELAHEKKVKVIDSRRYEIPSNKGRTELIREDKKYKIIDMKTGRTIKEANAYYD